MDLASLSPDSGYSSTDGSPAPSPHLFMERLFLELDHFVPPRELTWTGGDQALVFPPAPLVVRGEETGFGVYVGAHLTTLDCHVTGPSGSRYAVNMAFVPALRQWTCLFRPIEIGLHTGVVMDASAQHLPGSPFLVNVGRNYSATARSVVQLDVEMESEGRFLLRKPWGITSNSRTEEMLVADRLQHEILIYSADGEFVKAFGGRGSGPGQFNRPTGIAYDAVRDRLFVTDKDNHRVQVFTSQGRFLMAFGQHGNRDGQFYYPWGVAVSRCGDFIAVTDSRNHRVQLFSCRGKFLRTYQTGLDLPRGLVFSPNGEHLYVSDFNRHCVFQIHLMSGDARMLIENLSRPSGLDVDDAGHLLVSDSRCNTVKIFTPDGHLAHQLTEIRHGDGALPLDRPTDVARLRGGFVAIIDHNGRIRVV